jgi:hypothetical protein
LTKQIKTCRHDKKKFQLSVGPEKICEYDKRLSAGRIMEYGYRSVGFKISVEHKINLAVLACFFDSEVSCQQKSLVFLETVGVNSIPQDLKEKLPG